VTVTYANAVWVGGVQIGADFAAFNWASGTLFAGVLHCARCPARRYVAGNTTVIVNDYRFASGYSDGSVKGGLRYQWGVGPY
jgi:hypothetical protein